LFVYHEYFPRESGLPLNLIQGYRMLRPEIEQRMYRAPCPKVCVAKWLIDVGIDLGVTREQFVHVPVGIDHNLFRMAEPVEARSHRVAMLYHGHASKGARYGLQALREVKERVPDLTVALFGTADPPPDLPPWMTFARAPTQAEIVRAFNETSVFVCSSIVEGFGLANVEAMACGCALVTSANGGSDDYALNGETALVSEPRDAATMADHIEALLYDDDLRLALARRGREYVQRFNWDTSAELLEAFLTQYGSDPVRYLRSNDAFAPGAAGYLASDG
jgi:glycosyltransferase involved in cell wall biosynthesis